MDKIELQQDLLTSLRVSDSSFPGGNFGFSNGLEAVLSADENLDQDSLARTIYDLLENRWKPSDCVALRQCYRNIDDLSKIAQVDQELDKTATSSIARAGSIENGRALLSTAATLGDQPAKEYLRLIREGQAIGHIPIAQSLYWHHNGMNESQAIHLSLYSTASNYCQVAIRMGVVGALQAQRILTKILHDFSVTESNDFWLSAPSSFTPYSDIATLKLAEQGLRLFRN